MAKKAKLGQKSPKRKSIRKEIIKKKDEVVQKIPTFAKFNRTLLIFETALLLGIAEISFENWLIATTFPLHIKVPIIMIFFGGLFTLAFKYLRPTAKKLVEFVMVLKKKKLLLIIAHGLIITAFYVLYAQYFFGMSITSP